MKKFAVITVSLIILCFAAFMCFQAWSSYTSHFTQEKWEKFEGRSRTGMAKDLVERRLLFYKDRDYVVNLLGHSSIVFSDEGQLTYSVHGKGEFPSALIIKFSDEGKVVDCEVYID